MEIEVSKESIEINNFENPVDDIIDFIKNINKDNIIRLEFMEKNNMITHSVIKDSSIKEMYPDRKRSKKIVLCNLGIENGEVLTWKDNKNIKFIVIDSQKNIISDGKEELSISKMAQKILKIKRPIQGTLFFSYKGIDLVTLREFYE